MFSSSGRPKLKGARPGPRVADFEGLLEAMPDAVVGVDRAGVIQVVNRQMEVLFGYDRDALVGQLIESLVPNSFRTVHQAQRDSYVADPKIRQMGTDLDLTGRKHDGSEFPADISLAHLGAGDDLLVVAVVRDLTARKHAEEDRLGAALLAAAVESSGDAIITSTLEGVITSWNRAAERMYGYSCDEVIGKSGRLLVPKNGTDEVGAFMVKIRAGQLVDNFETIGVRKDGTQIPVSLTISAIHDQDGEMVGASTIARDMTEHNRAAQDARRLTAAEDLVRTVLASASIGIALADLDGSFRIVNRSLCNLLGHDEAWFLTRRARDMVHPDDIEEVLQRRNRVLAGSNDTGTLRLIRADGATIWARRVSVLIPGREGQPSLLMIQVEDVTAEHQAQQALTYQAFHDPLTGLHNRAWILDILQADLLAAQDLGASVGTLLVDLDNFNVVKGSLGHTAGDEVLAIVAKRIVAALLPGDRVGRLGGDSFVIVVGDVRDASDLEHCAERVSASIAADLHVQGHRIVPTTSIGIAVSSSTSTPESLLRDTDSALSRARAAGRARWQFFDDGMHAQAVARLTVEDQLRDAITRGEFVVYYQPIVALKDAHVIAHEALVRWAHPTRGVLPPGDFIDVAEESGLIIAIGAQVLDQVCAMLAQHPDLPGAISVNVSAVQLTAPDWLRSVIDTLSAHQVDPSRIVIEVTETAALHLVDSALNALASLSGLGVGIHLDDFGTGYSSISVLRDLPVTGVKLDLRFVQDLTAGHSQANALSQGLSGLVNGMHLTGIAEGIETEMQAHILRAQGWECGQGYYFGRAAAVPLSSEPGTANEISA